MSMFIFCISLAGDSAEKYIEAHKPRKYSSHEQTQPRALNRGLLKPKIDPKDDA